MNHEEVGISPSTNTKDVVESKETFTKRQIAKKPRAASSRSKTSKTADTLAENQENTEVGEEVKKKPIKKPASRPKKVTNLPIDATSSDPISPIIPKPKQPRKATNSKSALSTSKAFQSNVSQLTIQASKQKASTRRALLNSSDSAEPNYRRLGVNLSQRLPPTEAGYFPPAYLSNIFDIVRRHQDELLAFNRPEVDELNIYRPASFQTAPDDSNSRWLSPETLKSCGLDGFSSDLNATCLSHSANVLSSAGLDHVVCAILLTQEKSEEVIGWKKANTSKGKQFTDPLRSLSINQYTSSESCVLVGSDLASGFETFTTFNTDMNKYSQDAPRSLPVERHNGWSNARSLYYKGMDQKSAPINISKMSNTISPISRMNKDASLRQMRDTNSQPSANSPTSSSTTTLPSSTSTASSSSLPSTNRPKAALSVQSPPASNPRCRQQFLSPYKKPEYPSDASPLALKRASPFAASSAPQPKTTPASLASPFSPTKRSLEPSSLVENSPHQPSSRRRLDSDLDQVSNVSVSKSASSGSFPASPFPRTKAPAKTPFSSTPKITKKPPSLHSQTSRELSESKIYFNLNASRSSNALQFLSFLPCCTPLTRSLLSRYLQDFEQAIIQYNSGTRFLTEGKPVPALDLSALAQSLEGLLSRCSASSSRTLSTAQGIPMLRCTSLSTDIIMQNMSTVREREDGQVPCIQLFFSRPLTHSRIIKPMVELSTTEAPQLQLQKSFQIQPSADDVNWAEGQIRRFASTIHQPQLSSLGFDYFDTELGIQASPLLPKEAFGLTDTHDELALDLIEAELTSTLERLEARNTPTVFEVDPKVVKELTSKWLSATQQALDDLLVCMQRKGISAASSKTRYRDDNEHHDSKLTRTSDREDGSDNEDETETLTLEMTSMLRLIGLDPKTVRWNEEHEAFDIS